jgi:hypothetical protein
VFFGYTRCPDFCPLTLAEYKSVKARLGDLAQQVTFVFISVDGARGTAPVLTEHLARFDPEFVGFSGDDATLAQIQPDYGFELPAGVSIPPPPPLHPGRSLHAHVRDRIRRASWWRRSPTSAGAPKSPGAMRWWIENGSAAAFG